MADSDVGDINLLEWSHELDCCLLQLPFRPLESTQDKGSAVFLYKLAHSTSRKELGLLLLDCDTCSAYYEGLTLRTLDRRTQLGSIGSSGSYDKDDVAHLRNIIDAIDHMLDPNIARDPSLRRTVGLESTRSSCSLSISSKPRDDAASGTIKTTFDLDPLDHAAVSNLVSSHFVRPLLGLAAILARTASSSQIEAIEDKPAPGPSVGSLAKGSLELIRRSSLTRANIPMHHYYPLKESKDVRPSEAVQVHKSSDQGGEHKIAFSHVDLDQDTDMLFFGPPGCKLPDRRAARPGQPQDSMHALSPQLTPDEDEGDITITAPISGGQGSSAVEDANPIQARDCSDSDTSEEESLPLLSTHDAGSQPAQSSTTTSFPEEQSNRPVQASAPGSSAAKNSTHKSTHSKSQNKDTEATSLPPATFGPSPSQVSSSNKEAERQEQQRRRDEIAKIKQGSTIQSRSSGPRRSGGSAPPLPRPANVLASETCSYS